METPIHGYGVACILNVNALFHNHIGALLQHDDKSSPPTKISQPKKIDKQMRWRIPLGELIVLDLG